MGEERLELHPHDYIFSTSDFPWRLELYMAIEVEMAGRQSAPDPLFVMLSISVCPLIPGLHTIPCTPGGGPWHLVVEFVVGTRAGSRHLKAVSLLVIFSNSVNLLISSLCGTHWIGQRGLWHLNTPAANTARSGRRRLKITFPFFMFSPSAYPIELDLYVTLKYISTTLADHEAHNGSSTQRIICFLWLCGPH